MSAGIGNGFYSGFFSFFFKRAVRFGIENLYFDIVNGRRLLIFFQITQDKRGISGILRVFLNQIIGKINTDIYGRRQLREYFFACLLYTS